MKKQEEEEFFRTSKRQVIAQKVRERLEIALKKCFRLIMKREWVESARTLKKILTTRYVIQSRQFQWLGHTESWRYHFPAGGPFRWFIDYQQIQSNKCHNIFDLFNMLYMIQFYFNKMNFREVMEEYAEVQNICPGTYELLFGKANILYQRGQIKQANDIYKRLEKNHSNAQLSECLAWGYYHLDNKQLAMRYCQKSLLIETNPRTLFLQVILNPNSVWVHRWLQKLAEEHPRYFKIHLELAERTTDNPQLALEYFDEALSYDMDSGQINGKIAEFYLKEGNYQKAVQYQNNAQGAIDSKCSWGPYISAKININKKKYNDAIADLEKAIQLEPFSVLYNNELGQLYHTLKQPYKALQKYQICADQKPYNPKYEVLVAIIYAQLGDIVNSRKHIKNALEIDNNCVNALSLKGNIYEYEQNYQKAYQVYTIAKHLSPNDPRITLDIIGVCSKKGQYKIAKEKAIKCYLQELVSQQNEDKPLTRKCVSQLIMIEIRNKEFVEVVKWILRLPKAEQFDGNDIIKPFVDMVKNEAGQETLKRAATKVMGLKDRENTKMGKKIMKRICELLGIEYFKGPVVVSLDSSEQKSLKDDKQQETNQEDTKIHQLYELYQSELKDPLQYIDQTQQQGQTSHKIEIVENKRLLQLIEKQVDKEQHDEKGLQGQKQQAKHEEPGLLKKQIVEKDVHEQKDVKQDEEKTNVGILSNEQKQIEEAIKVIATQQQIVEAMQTIAKEEQQQTLEKEANVETATVKEEEMTEHVPKTQ